MLNSMLVNKDFLTWLLIVWRLCCQPIRCNVWKSLLTHWGRVTHICVSDLTNIGSDNGLSPGRRQGIIWTNAGILLIGPLGTNFNEILIKIITVSFKKMRSKVSSGKRRPSCVGLNVLIWILTWKCICSAGRYATSLSVIQCGYWTRPSIESIAHCKTAVTPVR